MKTSSQAQKCLEIEKVERLNSLNINGNPFSIIPNAGGHCYESGWKALSYTSGRSTCLTPENTASRHGFWWLSISRRSGLLYAIYLSFQTMRLLVELLRDAVLFGKFSQEHACCKWNLASTVTEFGKPRRDLSTIAWKSLYKFAVTRTPRATWVPQMCSYVEEVLWNETCWWNCDNGSMKPIHIRKILSASVRVTPSVSLPCEQSTDSFLKTEESLFQWNWFSQISW